MQDAGSTSDDRDVLPDCKLVVVRAFVRVPKSGNSLLCDPHKGLSCSFQLLRHMRRRTPPRNSDLTQTGILRVCMREIAHKQYLT